MKVDAENLPEPFSRVVLITGGAMGLGASMAQHFASQGDCVLIADINYAVAVQLAKELTELGLQANAFELDVGNFDSISTVFDLVSSRFGRVDVLINNAGIATTSSFLDCDLELWQRMLNINVTGTFLCGQQAARLMVKNRWGRIVNFSSVSGLRANWGRAAYGSSKAAVVGLTRQMSIELAEFGVTVNAIAPGPIDTPLTRVLHTDVSRENYTKSVPVGRFGTPDEIAATAIFLCSRAASFITGQTLAVDGGFMTAGVLKI